MTFQTFSGKDYLKIDIASNFGLDKASWDDRISWFDTNQDHLEDLVQQAKKPALFYAGIKAWRDVLAGKPIGYMISLDATSSGLQLLAALTGDRAAASLCNVIDTGKREDAYTNIYQVMLNKVDEESKIDRDKVKDAIMTSLYGSKAVPKRVFGEGELLNVFYDTMQAEAPAAWELNEAFLSMWNPNALSHDWVLPDNFHVHVKVMDRVSETVNFLNEPFEVFTSVNQPMENGRSLGANSIHSIDGMVVREMRRRCDYNPERVVAIWDMIDDVRRGIVYNEGSQPKDDSMVKTLWAHYQNSGYLSARILDHLTPFNIKFLHDLKPLSELLISLPEKPFKVISIHDCFRCLPQYGNDLRRQYARQLHEIAKSDLLSYLISQIIGRTAKIGKLDYSLSNDILETNYALS